MMYPRRMKIILCLSALVFGCGGVAPGGSVGASDSGGATDATAAAADALQLCSRYPVPQCTDSIARTQTDVIAFVRNCVCDPGTHCSTDAWAYGVCYPNN